MQTIIILRRRINLL